MEAPPTTKPMLQTFPNMVQAIAMGDEVLTAIKKAIHNLYDAHPPAVDPSDTQINIQAEIRIVPSDALLTPPAQLKHTDSGHTSAYKCGRDLAMVLREFKTVLMHIPEDGILETAQISADVVAGFHQWAAIRMQLGEDATYSRILAMFNVYTSQCITQAIKNAHVLSAVLAAQAEAISSLEVRNALYLCFHSARTHTSLRVSQVWAVSVGKILSVVVRSCTVPYCKLCVENITETYALFVDNLLAERKSKLPVQMHVGDKVEKGDDDDLRYTAPWAAFVANRYVKVKGKKKNGLCGCLQRFY